MDRLRPLCQPEGRPGRGRTAAPSGATARRSLVGALLAICVGGPVALAVPGESDLPSLDELRRRAARRFPQPVRAGDLPGRRLLAPEESQPVLGRVATVVRREDGGVDLVVTLAAWPWQAARAVAVPSEALGLLGEYVALLDLKPGQLRRLPAFDSRSRPALEADSTIEIGLVKPFH